MPGALGGRSIEGKQSSPGSDFMRGSQQALPRRTRLVKLKFPKCSARSTSICHPCPNPVLPCVQPPPDTQDPPSSQPQRPPRGHSTDLQNDQRQAGVRLHRWSRGNGGQERAVTDPEHSVTHPRMTHSSHKLLTIPGRTDGAPAVPDT